MNGQCRSDSSRTLPGGQLQRELTRRTATGTGTCQSENIKLLRPAQPRVIKSVMIGPFLMNKSKLPPGANVSLSTIMPSSSRRSTPVKKEPRVLGMTRPSNSFMRQVRN